MSKTFKIVLTVASLLAFLLLFVCIQAEADKNFTLISIPALIAAAIGAIRIIWKKDKGNI